MKGFKISGKILRLNTNFFEISSKNNSSKNPNFFIFTIENILFLKFSIVILKFSISHRIFKNVLQSLNLENG